MNHLLVISCSPKGAQSAGDQLTKELIDKLTVARPALVVHSLDLAAEPLPPVSDAYARAITGGASADDPVFAESERLILQLERCDALVITTPIHNFTLPATLKLWIDHVVRARRTFTTRLNGKVGTLQDRPVYIVVSSGGTHRGPSANQPEFLSSYLRHVLGCIGLFDLNFIYLQGMAAGPADVAAAVLDARRQFSFTPLFAGLEKPIDE